MQQALHDRLRCPTCLERLGLEITQGPCGQVESGWLDCWKCVARYPIVDGIPRFVPVSNYADSFGELWKQFGRAVLDSAMGVDTSRQWFLQCTNWSPESLKGAWVLDVGCGSGRFTEVALECGANVVAIDFSSAVDACRKHLGQHPRLHIVQADLFKLPFRPGMFDAVWSFGVLHRTPSAQQALLKLLPQLKDGGRLAFDIATPTWSRRYGPTAWLRCVTRRMRPDRAMQLARGLATWLLPLQRGLGRIPGLGPRLQRWLPIAPMETLQTMPPADVRERACLSMCDRLTAVHHSPCRATDVARWLADADVEQVVVLQDSLVVGRAIKKTRAPMSQESPTPKAA